MKSTVVKLVVAIVLCAAVAFGTIKVEMGKDHKNTTSSIEDAGIIGSTVTTTEEPVTETTTLPLYTEPVTEATSTTTEVQTTTTKATTAATTKATTAKKTENVTFGELATNVLKRVNAKRKEAGLSALVLDSELNKCAQKRADEMMRAKNLSHTRPDGSSCFTVLKGTSYELGYHGENVAYGYPNSATVVKAWTGSETHKANILSPNYKKMGIARTKDASGQYYWCQIFVG